MTSFEAIVEAHVKRWVTGRRLAERAFVEECGEAPPPADIPPPITFSLSYACGADDLVKQVASGLGCPVYDKQIIEAISRNTHIRRVVIEALDAGDRKKLPTFTEQIFGRHSIDDAIYFHSLASVVRAFALLGPCIFIGRGAGHLLANALRLRIVADSRDRVLRVVQFEAMGLHEAKKKVEAQDRLRRRFIRQFFDQEIDDPTGYHLCINLSRIRPDKAAALIIRLHRSLAKRTRLFAPDN